MKHRTVQLFNVSLFCFVLFCLFVCLLVCLFVCLFKATYWDFILVGCAIMVQLLTWLHMQDYHDFGIPKYISLKINSLPLNNFFSATGKRLAKWRQRFFFFKWLKKLGFCQKLKILYISEHTIWFKFHQYIIQPLCVEGL